MSKFSLTKTLYQPAVEQQNQEIEKTVINQSNEY